MSGRWRCVIMVPFAHTIEYARDLETAIAGAENLRALNRDVHGSMAVPFYTAKDGKVVAPAGEPERITYVAKVMEISGPEGAINEFAAKVAPIRKEVPTLTLEPEPPSGPRAA